MGKASESPAIETVAFIGVKDWQFAKPVYFGDRIHVVTEVLEMNESGRKRGRIVWKKTLMNQRGEAVQVGIVETLVTRRMTSRRSAVVTDYRVGHGRKRTVQRPEARCLITDVVTEQNTHVLPGADRPSPQGGSAAGDHTVISGLN